ncbi:MAG TPA: EAL domain-containing protein [Gaiellaceae bacterium]|nr:EAL domain-containing protein [Gaiellaceae bacterium]
MSPFVTAAWRDGVTGRGRRGDRPVVLAFGVLAVLLGVYFVSLLVRPASARPEWLDGWGVDAFELVVCSLAIGRGLVRRPGRGVALTLGGAALMWALGDVALTIESLGGKQPPVPSVADGFYLVFFPLAYLALGLMVRRQATRLVPATWLDGIVAGTGVAALCAAFAFRHIEHLAGGSAAAVATNLAYPVGDVLLLAMVVGGTALLSGERRASWYLVAAGCALNAAGDTFNLFGSTDAGVGSIVDGIAWPAAILMMSVAVWLRPARPSLTGHDEAPGFALPALGTISALAILVTGSTRHVEPTAIALAGCTLAVVALRLALSLRSLRSLTEERRRQAVTDQLTGLGNRRRLADVLERFFARSDDELATVAFLFVDLDGFKQVNDSFGHSAGDQLLRQIGPRIGRCLGDDDLLMRIGGDELAVLLVGASVEHATEVAQRISAAIREPFVLELVSVQVQASIGIAVAPSDARNADELMRHADQAMYRAKRAGAHYAVYDRSLDTETDRLRLLDDLRAALAAGDLELHYQPQRDLRTGELTRVEALLRWEHPRLGFVPPLTFLPLAEESDLMRPLTQLVLDRALAQCALWRSEGSDVTISVNVSAREIQDTTFTGLVQERLAAHDVPPNALILEITETTLISDFDNCKRVVDALHDLGAQISIDDFGAGFTSLAYLGRLPVGQLKLDRSFVAGLFDEDANPTLVQATIELAHSLGLEVVAEGVEDAAALELLERLGCDVVQGFHVARPAAAPSLRLPRRLAA